MFKEQESSCDNVKYRQVETASECELFKERNENNLQKNPKETRTLQGPLSEQQTETMYMQVNRI